MSEKNVVSSVVESLAVEFGADKVYEEVQKNGFMATAENYAKDTVNSVKETANNTVNKAKEVAGFVKEDVNALKESVSDLFASKEEKEAKALEETAKQAAEAAQIAAEAKAAAERRAALDKSYILHTALVTCDKAYTNEEINPSYIVLKESHGEYIHGLPMLTIKDCIADENVLNFGICRSPFNPGVKEAARTILDSVQEESKSWTDKLLGIFVDEDNKDVCDGEESLAVYCAAPCNPQFFIQWIGGKKDVLVDGEPALLGKCTLSCIYGGNIQIQTSGQYEE